MNFEIKPDVYFDGSLTLILTAAIVIACFSMAGNPAQAEELEPYFTESVFGAKGRQIEVPINYRDISKMVGAEFILSYDPDILDPVDVIAGVPCLKMQALNITWIIHPTASKS